VPSGALLAPGAVAALHRCTSAPGLHTRAGPVARGHGADVEVTRSPVAAVGPTSDVVARECPGPGTEGQWTAPAARAGATSGSRAPPRVRALVSARAKGAPPASGAAAVPCGQARSSAVARTRHTFDPPLGDATGGSRLGRDRVSPAARSSSADRCRPWTRAGRGPSDRSAEDPGPGPRFADDAEAAPGLVRAREARGWFPPLPVVEHRPRHPRSGSRSPAAPVSGHLRWWTGRWPELGGGHLGRAGWRPIVPPGGQRLCRPRRRSPTPAVRPACVLWHATEQSREDQARSCRHACVAGDHRDRRRAPAGASPRLRESAALSSNLHPAAFDGPGLHRRRQRHRRPAPEHAPVVLTTPARRERAPTQRPRQGCRWTHGATGRER